MAESVKAQLVALAGGCSPHAEPLVCDDLRGPQSLFGEASKVPRPRGSWNPCSCSYSAGEAASMPYAAAHVLWESGQEGASPAALADALLQETDADSAYPWPLELNVPSVTYIAGQSTSSFSLAWQLAHDGLLPEWGAVLCSCQTAGRGQLRRPWHSPRGNLYVSFRLPSDPIFRTEAASVVVGYMLTSALRAMGFPVLLKWPNDLLIEGEGKAGGILLEEKNGISMAGLGLNLCEAPLARDMRAERALPAAVMLPHHAGLLPSSSAEDLAGSAQRAEDPLSPFALWRRLVSGTILAYTHMVAGRSLAQCTAGIEAMLAWKGRNAVLMEEATQVAQGRLLGLGPGAGVLLRSSDGRNREHFSGSLCLAEGGRPHA